MPIIFYCERIVNNTLLGKYRDGFRDGLLLDTLPFWMPRSMDPEFGGYFTGLGRDGELIHTDKSIWFQGRMAWMLATLYNTVEKRPEWLDYAKSGIDFLEKYGYDADGRMFFSVTRDGKPLRKRRYFFSETFAVISYAAYGMATNDSSWIRKAVEIFEKVIAYQTTPGLLEPKVNPDVRPMKGLGGPMITLVTAQELRKADPDPRWNELIDGLIAEVERDFIKPEFKCVLETVGPNGEFIDTLEGRMITPGHSLELGWFVLHEAKCRNNDAKLIELGCKIIDWSFDWGWDEKFGGILYYRDCLNKPCSEYWSDMKFWWPHNETIIAMLLAWQLTGEEGYFKKFELAHDWTYKHFPDPEFGEWFGYLHRDGTVATELKGNLWKGMFHLPRMQWYCWQLLDEML